MAPKKSSTDAPAPKKSGTASAPAHASYIDMVKDAIINLKDRNGSSRQAIQKYIQANNKVSNLSDAQFRNHVNRAISSGEDKGEFTRPKGSSGPVKLAKKEAKSAASSDKKDAKPKAEKKAAAPKKAAATKPKATPTKKAAAPKKTTEKKAAAPKKPAAAAKPKANASQPRKTAPAAPAVEDSVSRVLGTTKSGRVTKTKAPADPKAPKKAAAAKKAAATKKTTPKKAAPAKKGTPTKKTTPKAKA